MLTARLKPSGLARPGLSWAQSQKALSGPLRSFCVRPLYEGSWCAAARARAAAKATQADREVNCTVTIFSFSLLCLFLDLNSCRN